MIKLFLRKPLAVLQDRKGIARLLWGSACYRLNPREESVGWTSQQRAARQKRLIPHRRFVGLTQPVERSNLAARILRKGLRELPALWNTHCGYDPLLAETVADIEAPEGAGYKAAGWTALGKTKGASRQPAEPMNRRTPAPWLDLIRGHWREVELRNHWRKDACGLEDKTRRRNLRRVGALALRRNLLRFLHKEEEAAAPLPGFVEGIAAHPRKAFSMRMRRYGTPIQRP